MKLLLLALCAALLFTAGNALVCRRCEPEGPYGSCRPTVETCSPEKDACIANTFITEPYIQYQECIKLEECEMLKSNTFMDIKCCTKDLCNHF